MSYWAPAPAGPALRTRTRYRSHTSPPLGWSGNAGPVINFRADWSTGRRERIDGHENLGACVIHMLSMPGKVHEFAGSLAQEISRRYPTAIANSPEPLVSPRRRFEILEKVFARARQISQEDQLGSLARIRMGSALRWHLKEIGYDEKFIEIAAEHLAASFRRKKE